MEKCYIVVYDYTYMNVYIGMWTVVIVFIMCVVFLPFLNFFAVATHRPIRIERVIAHRANGFGYPENTIEAVQAAHASGYWAEIDVRVSANNTPHLMHDPTLQRTTNCVGAIHTMTDEQLKACNVPTLQETLVATDGVLELDVKDQSAETLTQVVSKMNATNRIIYYASAITHSVLLHQPCPVIWSVVDVAAAKQIRASMRPEDMYALRVTDCWLNAELVKYVTQHSRNLDVALQGTWFGTDHHWYIRGLPVTHVEVDDARNFERNIPSPAMLELVYRASAIGIVIAFSAGGLTVHQYNQ